MSVLRVLGRQSSINVRKVLWTSEEIGIDYVQGDWERGLPQYRMLAVSALVAISADGG